MLSPLLANRKEANGFPFGPSDVKKMKAYRDVEGLVQALGELGDARAVEPLIAALGDKDACVRQAAVWALGKIGLARQTDGTRS